MKRDSFALRIAVSYFAIALTWILFSDELAQHLTSNPDQLTYLQNYKGAAFIVVTAAGLFLFVQHKIRRLEAARRALADTAAFNELLMTHAADGLIVVTPEGKIVTTNQSFAELTGYDRDELTGAHVTLIIPPEDQISQPPQYAEIARTSGEVIQILRRVQRKDGSTVMTEWHSKRLPNGLIQGMVRDVQEREANAAAMRRNNERLQLLAQATGAFAEASGDYATLVETIVRQIAESIGDGCMLCLLNDTGDQIKPLATYSTDPEQSALLQDMEAHMSFQPGEGLVGRVFATGEPELLALERLETILKEATDLWRPFFESIRPRSLLYLPIRARGERLGVLIVLHRDPQRPVYTEDDLHLAQDLADRAGLAISNAQLLQVAQRELKERAEAERALRESETRFRTMADTVPMLIWLTSANGSVTYINGAWQEYTGRPTSDALGAGWLDLTPLDERDHVSSAFRQAFVQRVPLNIEFRLRRADGNYGWVLASGAPRYNDDGEFAGLIGASIDLTERRQAETAVQALNDELERRVEERTAELTAANERLLELDEMRSKFVAHVTHDLRNPVASLSMRLHIMARTPERYGEHVAVLTEQVEHLRHLINSVLDLSRIDLSRSTVTFEAVNFNEIVESEVLALSAHAQDAGLQLVCRLADTDTPIWAVPNQLAQVVANLVGNAIHYTPSGRVEVSTEFAAGENMARLRVCDTGLGVAAEDIPHLFERFYRGRTVTEQDIPGSGLGLSIVKEVVDIHHGHIDVESEPGKGTTFTVWLPVAPVAVG